MCLKLGVDGERPPVRGRVYGCGFLFFFFKQKTAYEIKECDWSSDMCSSDLEWLSDHPNPGNREARIKQEAAALHFNGSGYQNSAEFNSVQSRLKGMSPALTAQQIANQQKSGRPV